jgi:hypothetical protein
MGDEEWQELADQRDLGLGKRHAWHASHFAQIGLEFLGRRLLGDGRQVGVGT